MKKILLLLGIATLAYQSQGQVFADPATGQMDVTTLAGVPENVNALTLNRIVSLKVPVYNFSQSDPLPAGSCRLILRLGNHLALDPSFNLAAAPLNAYFTWTSAIVAGQVEITGDLVAAMPEDFIGLAEFNVLGNAIGTSNITVNFQITNHNTVQTLTDDDPNNNTASLQYTVTTPLPVRFTGLYTTIEGCSIKLGFDVQAETNLSHYHIEASTDGIYYDQLAQLPANGSNRYQYIFLPNSKANSYFFRVQSVDLDGKIQYSGIKKISVPCKVNGLLQAYPNPIPSNQKEFWVKTNSHGPLIVSVWDAQGRRLSQQKIVAAGSSKFSVATNGLIPGQYLLTVQGNGKPLSFRFQQQ